MSNRKRLIIKKGAFILSGIVLCLFTIEILLQIGIRAKLIPYHYPLDYSYYSYNIVPYFSKPCCTRDSISGFRWINNGSKTFKICRGNIIFDQIIKPNNAGFISPYPFEPHKKDSSVFRWLIFGDSFTDGYFLQQNWPSAANDIIKSQKAQIELHSFALNGSGIKTWGRVFDWLNKMNYEYDGIIIACFGNDLSRNDFIMEHSGGYCYFGWNDLAEREKPIELQKERVILDAGSDENIREIISGKYANTNRQLLLPYYFHILYNEVRKNYLLKSQSKEMLNTYIYADKAEATDSLSLVTKYGKEKMTIIGNMLSYCHQNNKQVLLASVPDRTGSEAGMTGDEIQLNVELKWLASRYHSNFFDGYSALKEQNTGQLFLMYDGHWDQRGSSLFAAQIAKVILNESKMIKE